VKKPNFFIIGAPKCGTTSLVSWLADHPNIYMSPVKEPCFFNRDGLYKIETVEEYEALFACAGPEHLAVGEASTHYLYSREAVPRIVEYNPEARFIVCIRNPIEMVQALHAERVWQGRETIKDFEKAWRLQDERRLGKHIPKTVRKDPQRLQYGAYCRLGEQLSRLYSLVPKERVLVIVLDDMAENPRNAYQKVLAFLGVPDDGRNEFPVLNRRKAVRWTFLSLLIRYAGNAKRAVGLNQRMGIGSRLRSLNRLPAQRSPLSPELKDELTAYFQDDIHLLEELLDRDLSGWCNDA